MARQRPAWRAGDPPAWPVCVAGQRIGGRRLCQRKKLSQLGWKGAPQLLETAAQPAARVHLATRCSVDRLSSTPEVARLSVRESLAGKHILLIGVTGFIGKVWLVDLLENIPEIARITLLIRRNRTTSAQRRSRKSLRNRRRSTGCRKCMARGSPLS